MKKIYVTYRLSGEFSPDGENMLEAQTYFYNQQYGEGAPGTPFAIGSVLDETNNDPTRKSICIIDCANHSCVPDAKLAPSAGYTIVQLPGPEAYGFDVETLGDAERDDISRVCTGFGLTYNNFLGGDYKLFIQAVGRKIQQRQGLPQTFDVDAFDANVED